jgi:hypothetical protein
MIDIQKFEIPFEYQTYLELIFVDIHDFKNTIQGRPSNNNLQNNLRGTKIYRFL